VPAAEPVGPVGDDELSALFAPVAGAARIALAVSGGADSLALLHLFHRWRGSRPAPDAVVLTVDHRLRAGSRREAAGVVAVAKSRGIRGRVLAWSHGQPSSGIEAAARDARYRLLVGACREEGASHLLLAHHRDDQAETLLLRLARGSGIFGLAAMRPEVRAGEVTIFRPLLGLSRARLAATAALAGLEPVADPMNSDPRYARARIRRIMPLLAADGIDPAGLAAAARRFASAADAIDQAAGRFIGEAIACDAFGVARLDADRFRGVAREIGLRVLVRLLLALGGDEYPPRFDRLSALMDALVAFPGRGRFKRTLGGTVIEWRQGRFHFYRELGREGLPSLPVRPGYAGTWDHRFEVRVGAEAPSGLSIGPLGEAGRLEAGARSGETSAGALAALPAIRRGKALISVPSLGFTAGPRILDVNVRSLLAERLAAPPRFPEFAED
jgi:tRNA(Ile)-lysidine synthase